MQTAVVLERQRQNFKGFSNAVHGISQETLPLAYIQFKSQHLWEAYQISLPDD